MNNKSIKKNYLYNTANQILTLLSPLITAPYISRVLGAEGIGEYSYSSSIVAYFTLFATFGITLYGQREISYVQDDIQKRSNVFWEIKIFTFLNVFLCSIVYGFFLHYIDNDVVFVILYLNILTVALDISWFYQGLENFRRIVRRNFLLKIVNILYIFLVIKKQDDLLLYIAGMSIMNILSALSLWLGIKKYIKWPEWKQLHPFKNMRIIVSLFLPTIAVEIYTVLDKTMIGMFASNSLENGYYEQALKLSKITLTLVTALGTTMIPRIGYLFQNGEQIQIKDFMYRSYRFVWFLGVPLCFGLIGVAYNIVPWFYGEGYEKVIDLLKITSWLILAIGISNVTGMQYLLPTKRQYVMTKTLFIGAGINFLLNILLIPRYYSTGAAIGSVVAELVIAIVQLVVVRKELSIKRILKSGVPYFVAGGIMLMILVIEQKIFLPSVISTLCMIGSGAIVYFVILILLKDSFFIDNVKKVFIVIKNRIH